MARRLECWAQNQEIRGSNPRSRQEKCLFVFFVFLQAFAPLRTQPSGRAFVTPTNACDRSRSKSSKNTHECGLFTRHVCLPLAVKAQVRAPLTQSPIVNLSRILQGGNGCLQSPIVNLSLILQGRRRRTPINPVRIPQSVRSEMRSICEPFRKSHS